MPVTVQIPTALRIYVDQQKEIVLDGATVGDVLETLTAHHPRIRGHLFNDAGALRSFVNVYVNEEDIRYLQKTATELRDGDVLTIVPAVAGGATNPASDGLPELSRDEIERYSRHLILPEFGMHGQRLLKKSSVLCIGTGGLGSPLALYLAAAGIGRLGLVDFDVVDATNLQRQILHGTRDIGRSKLESARDSIHAINPHVRIDTYDTRLSAENALDLLAPYDVVVDGTDNFPTRYLVNDACVLLGKPNVYGSIFRFEGQASFFHAAEGPCYRCLYPEPPPPGLVPSCAEGGVLGILPGIIGVIQATETIKWLTGIGETLSGRLLAFNALAMTFREFKIRKDPDCPVCGAAPSITALIDYQQFCGVGDGAEGLGQDQEISPRALKAELDAGRSLLLLDVREPHEIEICRLEGCTVVPLGQLESRRHELDPAAEIVVYCRSGGRSAQATRLLADAGFPHVRNLVGGILAWSKEVDPRLPKY